MVHLMHRTLAQNKNIDVYLFALVLLSRPLRSVSSRQAFRRRWEFNFILFAVLSLDLTELDSALDFEAFEELFVTGTVSLTWFEPLNPNLQGQIMTVRLELLTCFVVLYCCSRLKYLNERLSVFHTSSDDISSLCSMIWWVSVTSWAGISALMRSFGTGCPPDLIFLREISNALLSGAQDLLFFTATMILSPYFMACLYTPLFCSMN